jgi:hypothetical protein
MGSYETQHRVRIDQGVSLNLNKISAIKSRIETNSPMVRFMGKSVIKREETTQDCSLIIHLSPNQ